MLTIVGRSYCRKWTEADRKEKAVQSLENFSAAAKLDSEYVPETGLGSYGAAMHTVVCRDGRKALVRIAYIAQLARSAQTQHVFK